jgi:hypothetical protein
MESEMFGDFGLPVCMSFDRLDDHFVPLSRVVQNVLRENRKENVAVDLQEIKVLMLFEGDVP